MKHISGKDFCRALRGRGWRLARIQGSHHIYVKHDNPAIIVVPVHGNRPLKTGLQKSIMKLAGLRESDL